MSVTLSPVEPSIEPSIAGVGDYIALMKPRVMSLVVFTALVGLLVAPGHVHPVIGFAALLCISVGAGAAGALNMWYDADIDARMTRTAARPIPAGRVAPGEALAFGLTLAVFAVVVLGLLVNVVAAGLLALTIAFYVLVYTMWLKRSTPQNIVIGGAAGALPPMIGWVAATGGTAIEPILLFLIIFFWTPPHFWALSLLLKNDYSRAGVPMMPVVQGDRQTRYQIVLYTIVLCLVTVLPLLTRSFGAVYLGGAVVLDGILLTDALIAARRPTARSARRLFYHSMIYLALLFAIMAIDRVTGL